MIMWHHYASQADQFVMGSRGLAPALIRHNPIRVDPIRSDLRSSYGTDETSTQSSELPNLLTFARLSKRNESSRRTIRNP